jgi:hypothetical protein
MLGIWNPKRNWPSIPIQTSISDLPTENEEENKTENKYINKVK